jgi:GTPase Era involved in 16S rRNA processing
MPVEHAERQPIEQELTFVRMFSESNTQTEIPEHVVVKKDSRVEILAGKVFVTLEEEESKTGIHLGVGPDIWVKVRVDGKEGWIHTEEDLQAVGLYGR